MSLTQILSYSQILLSVLLVAGILLQQKGSGLGSAMGGSNLEYSTKRGAEKVIFKGTIILTVLFIVVSVARIYFS
ncbi:MAG: preprotein translocase subunit SecG [Candidatus Yanofskybacteria bacterium CG10_big_fil_rev_8_21_14_0_10_37_15]|uniref:Protein-export membrane protein SecG n=1 Tax=Candidatus Yanofskybacteria bacterium CG10_big_fil_rev_8_21_14_0_10_37_15 TaxID=1975097 RepID=A0A2H0R7B6_9BACT|nr:MAG: preprotein translocase subunit SecG [Candidatus Yanofskybacteria bacterium CG10_big_fil_rev_8_21_14_0_10_37_15]